MDCESSNDGDVPREGFPSFSLGDMLSYAKRELHVALAPSLPSSKHQQAQDMGAFVAFGEWFHGKIAEMDVAERCKDVAWQRMVEE